MNKRLLTTAALLALGLGAQNAHAEAQSYTIDPSHTNILLSVSHLGFSTMVLEALQPSGTITFDQDAPENSSVSVTMGADHIDGDDEKFNHHLASADLFNAAEHPTITFNSTKIEVTGENTGKITGELSLLGVTKEVVLDTTFNKAGKNPFSQKETIGFTASAALKRSDFGMTYGLPMIGDDITIDINIEANKAE